MNEKYWNWLHANIGMKMKYSDTLNDEGITQCKSNLVRDILIQLIELSEGIYNGND